MRAVAGQGRWIWGVSGLVTAAALAIPGARLITSPGTDGDNVYAHPQHVVTRTETVPQPVTSLVVQSYGGQVQVTSGQVNHVQVTKSLETSMAYESPAGPLNPPRRRPCEITGGNSRAEIKVG